MRHQENRAELGRAYHTERVVQDAIEESIRSAQIPQGGASKRYVSGSASSSQAKSARGDEKERAMRSTMSSASTSRAGSTSGTAVPPRPRLQVAESVRDYASSRPSSASGTAVTSASKEFVPKPRVPGARRWADERDESEGGYSQRSSRASSSAAGAAVSPSATARGGPTAPRRERDHDPLDLSRTSRSEPERRDHHADDRDRDRDRRDDRRGQGDRRDRDRDRDRRGEDSRRSSTEQGRYRSGR